MFPSRSPESRERSLNARGVVTDGISDQCDTVAQPGVQLGRTKSGAPLNFALGPKEVFVNAQSLIGHLDLVELTAQAPSLTAWKLGLVENEDGVAAFMYHGGPGSPHAYAGGIGGEDRRPDRTYWESVKTEMHLFLCTDDKRYKKLWARIDALENKGTTALVSVIATFLGASIGAPATLVAGFVAVCLYGMAKLGKEAYCSYASPRDPSTFI
jgi:hypothetical protein